jgi:hypothetical protein
MTKMKSKFSSSVLPNSITFSKSGVGAPGKNCKTYHLFLPQINGIGRKKKKERKGRGTAIE